MPRWLVLVWLWASLAVAILQSAGCPDWIDHGFCVRVGNAVSLAFELFPATLATIFLVWSDNNEVVALAGVAVCTLICHFGVRKFVPRTIAFHWFAPAVIAWFVLGYLVMALGFWEMFGRPPFGALLIEAVRG